MSQTANETFDEFFIRLKRLAGTADLCAHCSDERMATRVMAGVRESESRKQLLSLTPFPTLQQAVNLCRVEESARANERTLSNQSSVNALNAKP
jgi:predicted phosphoadenosine phosphosulfate sulfurtransferase